MSTNAERIARLIDPFIEANKEAQLAYAALRRTILIDGEMTDAAFNACQDALRLASAKVIAAQEKFHLHFAPASAGARLVPSSLEPGKMLAVIQTARHLEKYSPLGGPDIGSTKCNVGDPLSLAKLDALVDDPYDPALDPALIKYRPGGKPWGRISGRCSHTHPNPSGYNQQQVRRDDIRPRGAKLCRSACVGEETVSFNGLFDGKWALTADGANPFDDDNRGGDRTIRYVMFRNGAYSLRFDRCKTGGWEKEYHAWSMGLDGIKSEHMLFRTVSWSFKGRRYLKVTKFSRPGVEGSEPWYAMEAGRLPAGEMARG